MNYLEEKPVTCPYCGENITILVDCSIPTQTYVEDCQVCCCPIVLNVETGFDDVISIRVYREDDS